MITVRAHTRRSSDQQKITKLARNIMLMTDVAMDQAAREIGIWAGKFVPLEQVGIEGEQAQRLRETL